MESIDRRKTKTSLFLSRHWVEKMRNFTLVKDTISFADKENIDPFTYTRGYSVEEGKKRVGNKFSVFERELRIAFLDLIHKTRKRHLSRGRIDAPKLYRAGADIDLRVFYEPAEVIRISSAFSLLIDLSGSMGGYKLNTAGDLALVFGNVLSKLNIPFEVAGFDTGDTTDFSSKYYNNKSEYKKYKNRRCQSLRYSVYKEFINRWNNRFPYLNTLSAGGYTPTHDAVAVACARLMSRREKKKILLVVTDGIPYLPEVETYKMRRELLVVIAKAKMQGIKVIGIGPEDAQVYNNFTDFVSVKSIEDMGKAVFNELKSLLLSAAMKSKLGVR